MDDITLITTQRPEVASMTDAERTRLDQRMQAVLDGSTGIDAGAHRGQRPRGRRLAVMTGVAAAVALVAVVVGASGRGPAPLQAGPSAAQQLRTIAATVATANPYPRTPYSVATTLSTSTGAVDPAQPATTSSTEQVEYAVDDHDYVSRQTGCDPVGSCAQFMSSRGGDPVIPFDGTAAEVRAGVEQRVEEDLRMDTGSAPPLSRSYLTLMTVQAALQDRAMEPAGRAELLRILADSADISATPDVANSYGLVGTRFSATVDGGRLDLVVDPGDGYILSSRWDGRGTVFRVETKSTTSPSAAEGPTPFEVGIVVSFASARPVVVDQLPADVAALGAAVAAHASAIEAIFPGGGCSSESGSNPGGWRYGFDIPTDLTFTHCWGA